ncbi:glutathione S-transferase A-like [Argopecten irradians]|uniref:glutathione S-transferase A-like n=1 Tax=Argopecten irradians TaxID=31199 RepID=UPI0037175BC4
MHWRKTPTGLHASGRELFAMGKKDMKLYWGSGSQPCFRVMIALHEKGFGGIDMKQIIFSENGHKCDEIMVKNHRGQVPTFNDGDKIVNESMAICLYLEKAYPNEGTKLLPDDPAKFAKVIQTAIEAQENLNMKLLINCVYIAWTTSAADKEGEEYKSRMKAGLEGAKKELEIWEGKLKKSAGEFICGETFTLADVVLFVFVATAVRFGNNLANLPTLRTYYDTLSNRDSIKASWPPHWKDGDLEQSKQVLRDM